MINWIYEEIDFENLNQSVIMIKHLDRSECYILKLPTKHT